MGKIRFTFTPPGRKFGMGHYSRILTLSEKLDSSGQASDSIRASINFDSKGKKGVDWITVGDFEWDGECSWWVFDIRETGDFQELEQSIAKESMFKTLVIDQLSGIFQKVDIHIVPSPFPPYSRGLAESQFFGWEFILSRFRGSDRTEICETSDDRRGVVLTGGADSLGVLPIWLETLSVARDEGITLDVVLGSFAERIFGEGSRSINLVDGRYEYPESFAGYSLGLVVHGVSTFDLVVSGVPVVIVPNPEAGHHRETMELSELGVAAVEVDAKAAAQLFLEILGDSRRLSEMRTALADVLRDKSSFSVLEFLKAH